MYDFPRFSTLCTLMVIATFLVGCSINGSYPDASEPDAAKLRFISNLDSATLAFFDAEHCDGQTTGLLNNLFVANTKRRANMTNEHPADAKAYLEVRLKPGSELLLQTNTLSTGVVCTNAFNFTPQSGAEYELTFDYAGNQCRSSLKRLLQVNGKVIRSPIILLSKGLPACAGKNPMFPKAAQAQPDTLQRTAMIEQIISESLTAQMKPKPRKKEPSVSTATQETVIDELKKRMGFTLPEAYWVEYRQNRNLFTNEIASIEERTLQLYKDEYRARLKRLDTSEIKKLLPDSDSTDLTLALSSNNTMLQYYYTVSRQVLKEALSNQQARMADLDKRYAICERFDGCSKN